VALPADPLVAFADVCRALTLAERARALSGGVPSGSGGVAAVEGSAPALDAAGRWRLEQWRALSPFHDEERFARRLALEGLDGAGLERLLATPAAAAGAALAERPPWMSDLDLDAFRGAAAGLDSGAGPATAGEPLPPAGGGQDLDPFLAPVRPWIERARSRLRRDLERLAASGPGEPLFAAPEAEALLAAGLPARLVPVLARTLVLELHVARHQGLLAGESTAERFRSFVSRLGRRDVAAALLGEYPVIAREVVRELAQWEDGSRELMERLAVDSARLTSCFFQGRHPGRLSGLDGGAGDRHRGGRSVRVLTFSSGARLVYKPRPLAVEQHFQELLAWLGDCGPGALRTVEVLDRGAYGWMEFVAARGCSGPDEVAAFYRRLGGLLAVLYALEATDCHFENLIAAADQPVLVDVETLFQARMALPKVAAPDKRLAGRSLSNSVLRIGLLPFLVGASEDFEGIDMSGVAAVAGKPSPQPVLAWAQAGTDEMRVVRERMPMPGGRNVPFLGGEEGGHREEVEAAEHTEELAAGFAAVYRRLVERRTALLDARGPLARFAGDPIRAVLRPTQFYARLLTESYHPDVLRDALDRDLLFDRLWIGTEDQPELERVVAAEHRDLRAGDVPAFSTTPDSSDLMDGQGARWAAFFPEPALHAVHRRLAAMGEADLGRQLNLLRLSLSARKLDRDAGSWTEYPPAAAAGRLLPAATLRARLLAAARAAGAWFTSTAVRDGRYASWVALEFRNKRWSLVPVPRDLYIGSPGIALFLGYLAAATGDACAEELARATFGTLLESAARDAPAEPAEVPLIGLLQGAGGVLYVAAHLACLWQDPRLLDAAAPEIERIDSQLAHDEDLDLVAGAAGAIAGLLAAHRAGASPRALAVAVRCGEHLLGCARQDAAGTYWLTRLAAERPLSGCAHGAAGIALALIQLGAASGDARFTGAGLAAFAWERAAFWPELRRWLGSAAATTAPPPESSVAMSWCYGAPGIGLARLAALRHLDAAAPARQDLEREIADALRLTMERGFGQSHCLCHGDLGNIDFLLSAQRRSGDAALGRQVRRRAQQVLAGIDRDGWQCGTRGGVASLGLMNGVAGIGYGLLRLADPDRVPSVLALAPPGGDA
jgi:type 2 lantibiotic biosynthesis protein LanM